MCVVVSARFGLGTLKEHKYSQEWVRFIFVKNIAQDWKWRLLAIATQHRPFVELALGERWYTISTEFYLFHNFMVLDAYVIPRLSGATPRLDSECVKWSVPGY